MRRRLVPGTVVALTLAGFWGAADADAQQGSPLAGASFKRATCVVSNSGSILRPVTVPKGETRPEREQRIRGGSDVFRRVAPAVVVVQTQTGHGTGFLADGNGLIVTNDHVVSSGLSHDPSRNASYTNIYLGALDRDGLMTLQRQPMRAYLLKHDPVRDLALLRLAAPASVLRALPSLPLADSGPRPGQDAAIVGHPSSGLLWTVRSGQISSVGRMPGDFVNDLMPRLVASQAERAAVEAQLAAMPSRRIIVSSVQANPGDSGGPVVDNSGRVLGVTFGIPAETSESKFTYHVHLDELKAMLENTPATPMLLVPDPWDVGPMVELEDTNDDGRPDVLLTGAVEPETVLFDLTNATPGDVAEGPLDALVEDRLWRFQMAIRIRDGEATAFYDTDNDRTIDLVVSGPMKERTAAGRFTLDAAGAWRYVVGQSTLVDAAYFKDPALAARARAALANYTKER